MKIKNKKGFITIYVMISMIFLITVVTVSLITVSRKLKSQTEINSSLYEIYNKDNIEYIADESIREISVYTKEQFDYLQNWITSDKETEYINVNGVLYKLDAENRDKYKIRLHTDLYYNLYDGEKIKIKVEEKVIANEFKIEVSGLKENYYKIITTEEEGVTGLVVIPKGFALVDTKTETEMPKKISDYDDYITKDIIENGLVVQDTAGNEFVWIPINDINEMVMCQQATGDNSCNIILDNSNTPICTTHGNETKMAGKLYKDESSIGQNNNATIWKYICLGDNTEEVLDLTFYKNYISSDHTVEPHEGNSDKDYSYTKLNGEILKFTAIDYYQPEFNLMVKNVIINKGFYVGRYETGGFDSDIAVVRKGEDYMSTSGTKAKVNEKNEVEYEINHKNNFKSTWLGMVGAQSEFSTTVGEKTIWKGDYNKTYKQIEENNNIVNSSMIWGCQFDQVLKFVNDKKDGRNNSYYVNIEGDYRNLGNNSNYKKKFEQVKTGDLIADKVANIFDLQGNMWERTLERSNGNRYEIRGGHYYSNVNASCRRNVAGTATQSEVNMGSRMTLNIESDENLIIYKDKCLNKKYLLYKWNENWDKELAEEIDEKYNKFGIKLLKGDADFDGDIDEDDKVIIEKIVNYSDEYVSKRLKVLDFNGDGYIDSFDISIFDDIYNGNGPLYSEWK